MSTLIGGALGVISGLMGPRFIADPALTEYKQVRFPKSKRKRIQKKWRKCLSNYAHVPSEAVYQVGFDVIAHPTTLYRIRREIEKGKPS